MIIVNGRVEQDLWMRPQVGEGGLVVQSIVEHLNHDIGAGEVGQSITENVVREKPAADPAALKVIAELPAPETARARKRPSCVSASVSFQDRAVSMTGFPSSQGSFNPGRQLPGNI